MRDPKDFLPARPPYIPVPNVVVKWGMNEYMEVSEPIKKLVTPEDKLLAALFGDRRILMVRCKGCGEWLKEEDALFLNNLAYHSSCSYEVSGPGGGSR